MKPKQPANARMGNPGSQLYEVMAVHIVLVLRVTLYGLESGWELHQYGPVVAFFQSPTFVAYLCLVVSGDKNADVRA